MARDGRGSMGRGIGLIFGFFLVFGVVFCGVAWVVWGQAQDFARNGVDGFGRVDKRWESTRECKDSNSDVTRTCTDFNVGYSYEVGGKTYHASGTTGYDVWAGLEEGYQIKLRYLPGEPGSAVTDFDPEVVDASGGMGVVALIFGGLGGLFALLGGGGLGWLIWRARMGRRLRETGTARGAVVVAQEETSITVNDRRLWRITWTDDAGGRGKSRGRARVDLPQPGARITVYVDPRGKLEAMWEGDT